VPDASINKAVAVRAGKSRVVICLPGRVVVDGKPTTIRDGGQFGLSDGGNVVRRGNVYFVLGPSGDSIRATVNSAYIDVSVPPVLLHRAISPIADDADADFPGMISQAACCRRRVCSLPW
jgi:hypothetical protein